MESIEEQSSQQNSQQKNKSFLDTYGTVLLALAIILLAVTQFQIYQISAMTSSPSATTGSFLSVFSGKDNMILAPALKADGTSGVREFPTISDVPNQASTENAVQDALNKYVPTGTPWYGQEAGVSFDDPLGSLNKWATIDGGLGGSRFHQDGVTIKEADLSPAARDRYNRLIMLFTCDFCCGSPQNPTRIGQCGCSHSAAWRGVFKFFLKNYEDKYTDEQLLGEASRWKALWYPGPYVKKVLTEGGNVEQTSLDSLPTMVGGC